MSEPILDERVLSDALQPFLDGGIKHQNLAEVALHLAALDHPGIDLGPYRAHLDHLAQGLSDALQSLDPASALALVLSHQAGYSGDRARYDDPDNADLIRVIDRRRGLPIALGLLYLDIAARANVPLSGLNVPGHFLVRLDQTPQTILDPFNDGQPVDETGLKRLLSSLGLESHDPSIVEWQVAAPLDILLRLLNNTKMRAARAGAHGRALDLAIRMCALAQHVPELWYERAELEATLGLIGAASTSLSQCLGLNPTPSLEIAARDRLTSARRSLN